MLSYEAYSHVRDLIRAKPQRRELPTAGIATAVWHRADWATLQPESADSCEMDDPEDMDVLWD